MQLRPDLHSKAKPPCQSIPAHTPGFQHPQLEMQEPLLIYRKTWAMYQAVACQRCRGFVCPVSIQEETAYTSRDGFARIGKHLSGWHKPESFGLFVLPQAERADVVVDWREKVSPVAAAGINPALQCQPSLGTPRQPPTAAWRCAWDGGAGSILPEMEEPPMSGGAAWGLLGFSWLFGDKDWNCCRGHMGETGVGCVVFWWVQGWPWAICQGWMGKTTAIISHLKGLSWELGVMDAVHALKVNHVQWQPSLL